MESVTEAQMWDCCFKAMGRFYCVLPFSENFLSTFPLPKFSFYLPNFCGKNTVIKILKGNSLWDNTLFKCLCWMDYNNDKQIRKPQALCTEKVFCSARQPLKDFLPNKCHKRAILSQLYFSSAAKLDPPVSHRSRGPVGPVPVFSLHKQRVWIISWQLSWKLAVKQNLINLITWVVQWTINEKYLRTNTCSCSNVNVPIRALGIDCVGWFCCRVIFSMLQQDPVGSWEVLPRRSRNFNKSNP